MSHQILLDVDTGRDDALALMFAVRHPDIHVQAITCVAGNTSVEDAAANTLSILDLVDAPEIPVALGARHPLIESPRDASWIHGTHGLGNVELPVSGRRVEPFHAVELMRRCLLDSECQVTLVALAPMTNVALLLRLYPDVVDRIKQIIFMGGSATVGNATPVAEFNFWHDPEAAHIVLNSGVPLTMYGWDVLWSMRVGALGIAQLCESDDLVLQVAGRLLAFEAVDPSNGTPVIYDCIGDAGTLCALVAPELFGIENRPVQLVLTPGPARGQTIVDRRSMAGEDSAHHLAEPVPMIDVVSSVRNDEVLTLFIECLANRSW
ncbi:nucleoside hydrolase [Nocardioides sp. YIM B13467]|uniref:nucleoside hydrolase n=1 Tax=Nocardioides sp. YIM B13467 TaxID=3366294 RepID=UPI0036714C45